MPSIAKFDQWQTTAGIPKETILQVKQTHLTSRYTQSITASTIADITDLNVSITPSYVGSRILLFGRWTGEYGSTGSSWDGVWGFKRSGVKIGDPVNPGATLIYGIGLSALTYYGDDVSSTSDSMTIFYVDSPGSTAEITYNIYLLTSNSQTLYTNRTVAWANQTTGHELTTSTILAMEIGG